MKNQDQFTQKKKSTQKIVDVLLYIINLPEKVFV